MTDRPTRPAGPVTCGAVMDAGRVRAIGTHAELVIRDELYAELAATQVLATAE